MKNLTEQQLVENYQKLVTLVEENFTGDRKERLLEMYEFFQDRMVVAPASGKPYYHYCFVGGYIEHVLHIVETAKRFPMLSSHNLIVVREAQNLDKSMDIIADYLLSPQVKTVLVICYKYKKIDKRTKLYKAAKKIGVILESNPLYDNKLSPWILGKLKDYGLNTDNHGLQLLCEALGNDLNKIEKQIEKLKVSMGDLTNITPDLIEEYVGFSKDFNNFELYRALGSRDFRKCCQIVKYMSENPKNHPLILTIS